MIRLILLLLPLLLFSDIDDQIEAIQHASVKERFKLMNAFKNEIIQMREEKRFQALHKLQAMTKDKTTNQSLQNLQKKLPEDAMPSDLHDGKLETLTGEDKEIEDEKSIEEEIENHTEQQEPEIEEQPSIEQEQPQIEEQPDVEHEQEDEQENEREEREDEK